ncbi:ubiquitin carboxyl-terminal hydrolase 2 [Metarhizium acridum CQMa 102]|uniref:Ubiquitin carboxyl-terminal hydrolase 2 n=1 Tax=Metarhizium acridum (strain CQMa 102) TaxID=655827 RepID=E9DVP6_METAQ|nr:ubiquitin carboxyl-terminal hydrolase 2 [Metarhizium acridum CQMa 102]EFY92423.1 ubiquitin carboxyl-terminal hydrolase 2 [Metarhizium acridum CQMa 102]
MSTRPTTPASPKNAKVKSPVPGIPMFGCEHVQLLLSQGQEVMNSSIAHYKMILRGIFDSTPIVPQTSTNQEGRPITSLTSNYLCLQCPTTVTEEDRLRHGTKKSHRFYVDSRSGSLYCQICDDLVWDPTLEELRVRKIGTGSFSDFYALENTNGYTAANILSGFWISEKKAFENLVTTREQDAHEFFQFLAEELHERNGDGKRPEIGSEHSCNCIIHQTFYGKMQTTTTCQNCKGTTNTVQSFLDLSLGLDTLMQRKAKKTGQKAPVLTLNDCLDEEYVKFDKCEYRCHSCSSTQQAKRYTSIKRLPNVLSIQLKRFEYKQGRHDRAASKIDHTVQFPLQLNMLPYTNRGRSRDNRETLELERSCMYDLLSVIVHVGEIETGHYVSYCRVGDQTANGKSRM